MRTIEADYLVVGAGAMGMAFIDTLVSETEARVVVMDRHDASGGRDDAVNNELCVPVPHPDTDLDWLRLALADCSNQLSWFDDPELMSWLSAARLDLCGHLIGHLLPSASARPRVRDRILTIAKSVFSATVTKLDQLVAAEAALAAP
jgi:hypothetical protein